MAIKKSAAKKTVRKGSTKKAPTAKATPRTDFYLSLNELWHAIRHMSLLEETVCTLREEARQGAEPDAAFRRDLKRLLQQLPVRETAEASAALSKLAR